MMTAQEARELSETSGKTITAYVRLSLEHVKAAAELGLRKKVMYCLPWEAKAELESVKPTKIQSKIMDELSLLGYDVAFEREDTGYVPRGLEDDAPLHYNEVIVVRW